MILFPILDLKFQKIQKWPEIHETEHGYHDMAQICYRIFCSIRDKLLMRSCTNEEPRYFGTKAGHVKANDFTIQTVGVYVPPWVPLLIGRCHLSKHVSQREAYEQTAALTNWGCASRPPRRLTGRRPLWPGSAAHCRPNCSHFFNVAGAAV